MSRRLLLFTCITLLLVLAPAAIAGKGGGKGGGGGKIPVSVTFRDSGSVPDRLGSSCYGEATTCFYINKEDNVSATVGSAFHLKRDRRNNPIRPQFYLDFQDCSSGPCELAPFDEPLVVPAGIYGANDWRDMGPGEVRPDEPLRVLFFVGTEEEMYWLFFKNGHVECDTGEGYTGVSVTRSDDPDVWTIEARPGEHIACLWSSGDDPHGHMGNFYMPFRMTVVGLQ